MKTPPAYSRRQWLGLAALPAVAATLGAKPSFAAEPTTEPVTDRLAGARTYNIRDFGAKGDGVTLNTAAIQAAIDAAHAAAGGTVLVPAGDFVTGTVELKSNVSLHLAAQGRLLGSPDKSHYRPGSGLPSSNGNIVLVSAANAENIVIEGNGTIDGNGAKFFTGKGDMTGPGQNSAEGYSQRPHLAVFYRCRNLRLRDAFFTASAYHMIRILECHSVFIDGVRIHSRVNKNNDGFHLVSNQYVHIASCDVACQDDACALFGSNRFVTITNCTFSTRWSVFRFGGGSPGDITITNCVINETYGCPIKMRFGAGNRAENISFANLVMHDVTGPISIGLDSRSRRRSGPGEPPARGVVRNISFNGIRATVVATGRQFADLPWEQVYRPGEAHTCIVLNGANDDTLENISFTDVQLTVAGGGTAAEGRAEVPQIAGEYFEIGPPPAHGLYARGVRGLTLHNVRIETVAPDLRPAVVFDRVADAAVSGLAVQGQPAAESALRFTDSRDVLVAAPRLLTPAALFLQVEGAASANIALDGGDLTKAGQKIAYTRGAAAPAAG